SSRRRHTRLVSDWSSDVCSSDLHVQCDAGVFDFCGSASAIRLKVENSCVALDMLIDTSTILPSLAGLPSLSSVVILADSFLAAEIGRASCRERVASVWGVGCVVC